MSILGSNSNLSTPAVEKTTLISQQSPSITLTSTLKNNSQSSIVSTNNLESPFFQLLNLLSQPFITKCSTLTDRLIRLLHSTLSSTSFGYYHDMLMTIERSEGIRAKYPELELALQDESKLQLLVNYMKSNTSSLEGQEDANNLMTKLSNIFPHCREVFYRKMLEGAKECGNLVLQDIEQLMAELEAHQSNDGYSVEQLGRPSTSKFVVQDRYDNQTSIVLHGKRGGVLKGSGKEIHLPSMSHLMAHNSNQNILLRLLDIVVVLRGLRKAKRKEKREKISAASAEKNTTQLEGTIRNENETNAPNASAAIQTSGSMDVDLGTNTISDELETIDEDCRLSQECCLDLLWNKLSDCLDLFRVASDERAVLVLESIVEAFFLVHTPDSDEDCFHLVGNNGAVYPPTITNSRSSNRNISHQPQTSLADGNNSNLDDSFSGDLLNAAEVEPKLAMLSLPVDVQKFLNFAEQHRVVLNQILRQMHCHLGDGTFACLVEHPRILDFDVKRKYFREELKRVDNGLMRRGMSLHINRANVFEDSFRQLDRLTAEEWKGLFRISFDQEEGQDAGGLLREWYTIIAREIFNPNYALFTHSPGDGVTYMINQLSHFNSNHLNYFKFVGRLIGKAIYENQLLDCYFTRSFYKHMLGKSVKYTDMEAEDTAFYNGLVYLLENNVADLGSEMTFSLEVQEFGQTKIVDLKPNGRNILVTEENKHEYVRLVCQEKMTGSIKQQLKSFLEGKEDFV